jgi:hypothetical protein
MNKSLSSYKEFCSYFTYVHPPGSSTGFQFSGFGTNTSGEALLDSPLLLRRLVTDYTLRQGFAYLIRSRRI